ATDRGDRLSGMATAVSRSDDRDRTPKDKGWHCGRRGRHGPARSGTKQPRRRSGALGIETRTKSHGVDARRSTQTTSRSWEVAAKIKEAANRSLDRDLFETIPRKKSRQICAWRRAH